MFNIYLNSYIYSRYTLQNKNLKPYTHKKKPKNIDIENEKKEGVKEWKKKDEF